MSSTQTSNRKRRRASSHREESTAIIRRRSIVSVTFTGFESLVDDTLDLVLQFVGEKSYGSYGSINKRCREVFLSKNLPKETFLYGYAPFSFVQEKISYYHDRLIQAAVAYNRNDILQWLVLEKSSWAILPVFNFAATVSLNTLKRVQNFVGDDIFTSMKINEDWNVSDRAASGGRLDVLKWLKNKGWFEPYYEVFSSAAEGGHLNVLEFLKENKCHLYPEDCLCGAARGGSLVIIHWLLQNGCSFEDVNEQVIKEAAQRGHLHVIKFFVENGFSIDDIDKETSRLAAEEGHLHVLQWLHDNNCTFDEETFAHAGMNGNIDNLQWLLENNCPWDKQCYESADAAFSNRLEVLEWLKEKGCPRGDNVLYGMKYHTSELIDWLSDNGFTLYRRLNP